MNLTQRHIDILKHATEYPEFTRNSYNVGTIEEGFEECEQLCKLGFMSRRDVEWIDGFIYRVTVDGFKFLTDTD